MRSHNNTTVQGLRAVAVLLIVLFHFKIPFFGAGFLGVDIFYVLSGFIITTVYFDRLTNFQDYAVFIKKRFHRLFPALFVVCSISFLFAFFILSPAHLEATALHFISSLSFFSNIVYWKEQSYFDIASEFKPLLHTWSLSLEWQFYLVMPILLVAIRTTFGIKGTTLIIIGLTLFSFAISYTLVVYKNFHFYMLPCRAWEFGIGVSTALLMHRKDLPTLPHRQFIEALFLIGMFLFIMGFSWFEVNNQLASVFACSLTGLYLWTMGNKDGILNMLPIQYIGNISYSIYLIHWPLITLFSYHVFREPTYIEKTALFVITVFLSAISNSFIEIPGKSSRLFFGNTKKRMTSMAVSSVLFSAAFVVIFTDGLPQRYKRAEQEIFQYFTNQQDVFQKQFAMDMFPQDSEQKYIPEANKNYICSFDKIIDPKAKTLVGQLNELNECVRSELKKSPSLGHSYLVIGDSNGRDAFYALKTAYPDYHFTMLMNSGCAPAEKEGCFIGLTTILTELLKDTNISGYILTSRFSRQDFSGVENTVKLIQSYAINTLIIGPSMSLRRSMAETFINKNLALNTGAISINFDPRIFVSEAKLNNRKLLSLARKHDVTYADRLSYFCSQGACKIKNRFTKPLLADTDHLSVDGIEYLSAQLKKDKLIQKFFASRS